MRKMLPRILPLLLWALAPAMADVPGATLTGQVVDRDGAPLWGVMVSAYLCTTMTPTSVTTDRKGRFRIAPLPPRSDYLVVAELEGYSRVKVGPIGLETGKITNQNFTLFSTSEPPPRKQPKKWWRCAPAPGTFDLVCGSWRFETQRPWPGPLQSPVPELETRARIARADHRVPRPPMTE